VTLVVVEPGLLTTVQDAGRFGHGVLGVSACGAADPVSLRVGNRLVGNADGAAALEMTLRGATLRTDAPVVVALCGSDFEASLPSWTATVIPAGGTVAIGPTRSGARCTLCVRGGVAAPPVLGSASTHLPSGLGGIEGRALRKGDRLEAGPDPGRPPRGLRVRREALDAMLTRTTLRATPGPQLDWFAPESAAAFWESAWEVTQAADRMGLRLRGASLARARAGDLVSEGVALGAVQVAAGGEPIILFVDQQTTGGYPKIANVIAADFAALGQLRPRTAVRFEQVGLAEARRIFASQEAVLDAALEDA
jgi:antagonist of KipI